MTVQRAKSQKFTTDRDHGLTQNLVGSDLFWDALASSYFGIAAFYPLRDRVQDLAKKYRNRTQDAFVAALKRLVQRYIQEKSKSDPEFQHHYLGFQSFFERVHTHKQDVQSQSDANGACGKEQVSSDSQATLSTRQDRALAQMANLLIGPFLDGVPIRASSKDIVRMFGGLAAQRSGPRSLIKYRILLLDRNARTNDRELSYGRLANLVFDGVNTTRHSSRSRKIARWPEGEAYHLP